MFSPESGDKKMVSEFLIYPSNGWIIKSLSSLQSLFASFNWLGNSGSFFEYRSACLIFLSIISASPSFR